jgi:hypothetical protein
MAQITTAKMREIADQWQLDWALRTRVTSPVEAAQTCRE